MSHGTCLDPLSWMLALLRGHDWQPYVVVRKEYCVACCREKGVRKRGGGVTFLLSSAQTRMDPLSNG